MKMCQKGEWYVLISQKQDSSRYLAYCGPSLLHCAWSVSKYVFLDK